MNKNIFAVVMLMLMTVINAVAQVPADYKMLKDYRTRINYDFREVNYIDTITGDTSKVLVEAIPNNGLEFGVYAGANYFNGNVAPIVGVDLGYVADKFSIDGSCDFGISEYNKESTKAGQKYLMTSFHASVGIKLFDIPTKYHNQIEVWGNGVFGYMLRKDYNAISSEGETEKTVDAYHVKGSSMTFGGELKVVFKSYRNRRNFYVKADVFTANEYYLSGAKAKMGGSLAIGINFVGEKKVYNKEYIESCGGMEQYNEFINKLRADANKANANK